MKNTLLALFFLISSSFYYTDAQQIVKTDTLSGTKLTLSMDNRIDKALSELEECSRETPPESAGTRILVPSRELSTAEICRRNPRIQGFKIQISVVKSNAEANEVKTEFRRKFPQLKVLTDASLRPNYKLLAGSYFTRQSAAADLSRIRQHFPTAVAVPYSIFCVEGK